MSAVPARAPPERILDHPHRKLELERLDRGVERVAHRHVHAARAVRVRARALTAADRLVVDDVFGPERDVVHRPLSESSPEGAQDNVGHP